MFLSSTRTDNFVSNVSHTAVHIDCHIELYRFLTWICLWHALSFYLKMLRAKKFALKPKFIGNKYVVVNNSIGVSERGLTRSDKSSKNWRISNLSTSNKKIKIVKNTCTSVNTEINFGKNNVRCGESEFTEYWNIVVSALCLHKQEH